jgi:hydroxymethylpyrimidine/phosphomethylpyrimidine kinase
MNGRVLVIAGSDSGGGAGIQADIKTITALGGFAMTAITALTAQNTLGVQAVLPVPPDFIRRQIEVVLQDLGADVIKIGMLGDAAVIETVAEALRDLAPNLPVVLDPVMVAKGGQALLAGNAVAALTQRLLPAAVLITPNLPEAEALTGLAIRSVADMARAAEALRGLGARAILMKGGHLEGDTLTDLLVSGDSAEAFSDSRIDTRHTHGTGCTTASAIAAGLAQGLDLRQAVIQARRFVRAAIAAAPGFGGGHGPLNHTVTVDIGRIGSPASDTGV